MTRNLFSSAVFAAYLVLGTSAWGHALSVDKDAPAGRTWCRSASPTAAQATPRRACAFVFLTTSSWCGLRSKPGGTSE